MPAQLPKVLFEIGKLIGSRESLDVLLEQISAKVCDLLSANACSVVLVDDNRQELVGKAAHGLSKESIRELRFRQNEGVAGWVVGHAQAALIDDVTTDDRFVTVPQKVPPMRSMACVPLMVNDRAVGALTLTHAQRGAFHADTLDVLSFVATTIALDLENHRLRRLSVTDSLTGAFNRALLSERLPAEMDHAVRKRLALSIALFDLDHFKTINDHHGHLIGDRILAAVAQRLRSEIRSHDILIRYGGEEFLVVLPDADRVRAREVGDRVRLALENDPIEVSSPEPAARPLPAMFISVSCGIAQYAGGDEGPETLIERADKALYEAKRRGRNRVEVAE